MSGSPVSALAGDPAKEATPLPWDAAAGPEVAVRPFAVPPKSADPPETRLARLFRALRTVRRAVASGIEWTFGLVSAIVGLAALAGVPGACLATFGYLLEVSGRIGRTGKLSAGWIGIRPFARLGSLILGAWLLLMPLRLLLNYWDTAVLIGNERAAGRLWIAYVACAVLLCLHVSTACLLGGKLRHFLWPFPGPFAVLREICVNLGLVLTLRPRYAFRRARVLFRRTAWGTLLHGLRRRPVKTIAARYVAARDAVWDFVMALRLPYYFSLGARGLLGTWIWLWVPTALFAAGTRQPAAGFLGGFLLGLTVLYLPLLQAHFAAENRFGALFERGRIRNLFARAPWAWAFSLTLTQAAAIPLYLLYIEYPPEQIRWLPALVFTVFALPARMVAGWAYACALHRPDRAAWYYVWTGRLWTVVTAGLYVFILFFVQYVSQDGRLNLFDQHAFSVPLLMDLLRELRGQ